MKKFLLYFVCSSFCLVVLPAFAAVSIKKAEPVAKQETSAASTTASLVPTVINLVSGIQQLSSKQKAMTAECIPTTQELNFVNNMMKEWAKTGTLSVKEVETKLGWKKCSVAEGGYESSVKAAAIMDTNNICFDYFSGAGNTGMVWEGYPKAVKVTYCEDGSNTCKDKKTASNIYEIFNLIDFDVADYTASEATMAAKLLNKIESCSNAKLSAKKRAMWGEFLTDTITNIGQPTSTGTIMEQVGSIVNSGGGLGSLSTLGAFVTKFAE